jgi:hypothetical protein
MLDYTEPVTEGGSLTMICETLGGDPLPRVSWWRGTRLIDDIVDEVDAKSVRVRNSLRIINLQRKDQVIFMQKNSWPFIHFLYTSPDKNCLIITLKLRERCVKPRA